MAKRSRDNPALGLAARIRSAANRRAEAKRAEELAQERRRAEVAAALDRLFDHLQEAGEAAEVLDVKRDGHAIDLGLDGRSIRIASTPGDDAPDLLGITAPGLDAVLSGFHSRELDRWALRVERRAPEGEPSPKPEVLILLGAGLELLVEEGLMLPLDGDDPPTRAL